MQLATIADPCRTPEYEKVLGCYWLREPILRFDVNGVEHQVPNGFVMDGYSFPFFREPLSEYCMSIIPAACHDWDFLTGEPFFQSNRNFTKAMRLTGEPEEAALFAGLLVSTIGAIPYFRAWRYRKKYPDFRTRRIAETREQAEEIVAREFPNAG